MVSLSKVFRDIEARRPGAVPDLRAAASLVMTSDYSGCHQTARYDVSAFLVVTINSVVDWDSIRRRLRAEQLRDGRRLSFKGLRDQRQQTFLPRFLKLAERLHGVLVVIA